MVRISYHVSHEQFSPRELLDLVRHAEAAGFDAAFSSDHIQPWLPQQGHSGHLWAWLGAALQATQRMTLGAITVPGGWRYHPAVVAHGIATLAQMFPDRMPWIAFGSGEALNECVVGTDWPDKATRNVLLKEATDIVRRLLQGETVTRSGPIPIEKARLWTLPRSQPQLVGAALSESTASFVGEWADGLLTVGGNLPELQRICAAFREVAPSKPIHAKVDLCWARDESAALRQAHAQWRWSCIPKQMLPDFRTPEHFDAAASAVTLPQMREAVLISSDLPRYVDWLNERIAVGLDSIDLHHVGTNQREFIDAFGTHVLPALRKQ